MMYWGRVLAAGLVWWAGTVWGATLNWNANTEPDLAGYRIYRCSQQPCGRSYGTATLLSAVGRVTSFNIGTPSTVQYYVITAYDSVNNESTESNVVTYTPPLPPPSPTPTPIPQPTPVAPPTPTGLRFAPAG